jgi:hypothetical protein
MSQYFQNKGSSYKHSLKNFLRPQNRHASELNFITYAGEKASLSKPKEKDTKNEIENKR